MWTKHTNILYLSESLSFYTNSEVTSRLLITGKYVTEKVEENVSHKHNGALCHIYFRRKWISLTFSNFPLQANISLQTELVILNFLQKLKYPAVSRREFW